LIKALANGVHSAMTNGEHDNAYEPGDECQDCIDWAREYGPFVAPAVVDFVAEWLETRDRDLPVDTRLWRAARAWREEMAP
jgi:hypothetical protein